jgi:hypothetical protein
MQHRLGGTWRRVRPLFPNTWRGLPQGGSRKESCPLLGEGLPSPTLLTLEAFDRHHQPCHFIFSGYQTWTFASNRKRSRFWLWHLGDTIRLECQDCLIDIGYTSQGSNTTISGLSDLELSSDSSPSFS